MGQELDRKLDERQYRAAVDGALETLRSASIDFNGGVLARAETEVLLRRFVDALSDRAPHARLWPEGDREVVADLLGRVAARTANRERIWFASAGGVAVAVEIPAQQLLANALHGFVSPAADLMLSDPDISTGICVELNRIQHGALQYEVVAWGEFDEALRAAISGGGEGWVPEPPGLDARQ
ncbi:MAG: hypothetical protein U0R24_00940 [Solirubrobacterales bacterium]